MSRRKLNVERFTIRKPSESGRRFNTIIGEVFIDPYAGMNNTRRYLDTVCTEEWKKQLLDKLNLPKLPARWYRISIRTSIGKIVFELDVRQGGMRYYTPLDQIAVDNQTILNHLKSLNWSQFDTWCKSIDARTVLLGCEPNKFTHVKYLGNAKRRQIIQAFLPREYTVANSKQSFFNYDVRRHGKSTPIHIGFHSHYIDVYIGVGTLKNAPYHTQNSLRALIQRLPKTNVEELAGYLDLKHQSLLEECMPIVRPYCKLSNKGKNTKLSFGFKWSIPYSSLRYLVRDFDVVVDLSAALRTAGRELILNRMFEVGDYA